MVPIDLKGHFDQIDVPKKSSVVIEWFSMVQLFLFKCALVFN